MMTGLDAKHSVSPASEAIRRWRALPVEGTPTWAWPAILASFGLALACSGNQQVKNPATGPAAECPAGQTFDGQFCRVEGELAQSEPLPAEATAEQQVHPDAGGAAQAAAPGDAAPGAGAASEEGTGASVANPGGSEGTEAAQGAEHATPVDVSMAAQAGPVVTYLAGSHLPAGAQPLGAPFAAQFVEGQIFEQKVHFTVGRCYTVVAVGIHPVRDVDIELFEEGADRPVAEDDAVGPQAVLGSRSQCFKPTRGDLKLVISVAKGQGVVAGQVFEK